MNPTFVGQLLTAIAILVSGAALAYSWFKDRALRRTAYADGIRKAAGVIIAKLERWAQISEHFFDDIQPCITDADAQIMESRDVLGTRDDFWRAAHEVKAAILERISNEEIEIAYAELYGYDSKIYDLYSQAVLRLRLISDFTFRAVVQQTQKDILSLDTKMDQLENAQLGNLLRGTCGRVAKQTSERHAEVTAEFRNELLKVIRASDLDIEKRRIQLRAAHDVLLPLKSLETLLIDWRDVIFVSRKPAEAPGKAER